jgi:hypothetical protein
MPEGGRTVIAPRKDRQKTAVLLALLPHAHRPSGPTTSGAGVGMTGAQRPLVVLDGF